MRWIASAALPFVLGACFKYVPVSSSPGPEGLQRGSEVRVHLAQPAQFKLLEYTADNVRVVQGELIRFGEDALLLSAGWLQSAGGYEHRGRGETLEIPASNIAVLERKQVDGLKTAGFAGGWVALAVAGVAALTSGGTPPSGNGGPPPPSQ